MEITECTKTKYAIYSPTVGYYAHKQDEFAKEYSYTHDVSKAGMCVNLTYPDMLYRRDVMIAEGHADTVIVEVKIRSVYEVIFDAEAKLQQIDSKRMQEYLQLKTEIDNIPINQDVPSVKWKRFRKLKRLLQIE